MSDLPQPESRSEFYWHDIALSLRRIGTFLEELEPVLNVTIVTDDEAKPEPIQMGTPLPDDLPGRDKLAAAGITILESVPRDGDALIAIEGIGATTAGRILSYLANL